MNARRLSVFRPLLLFVGGMLVAVVYVFEGGLSAPVTIAIQPGDDGASIGALLYEKGILHHPTLLKLSAKVSGDALKDIQPGAYTFAGFAPLRAIHDTLSRAPIPISITIPEGLTASQVAALLESEGIVTASEFMRAVTELDFPLFPRPPFGWEGFLFPATYDFPEGLTADRIVGRMVTGFFGHLPVGWPQIVAESGRTLSDIVIVASLVQREAFHISEMRVIASVIYNRLQKKMPLQIDATVAYALNKWGSRLTYEDLEVDHPYNTYTRMGLPPGPIGNPGIAAINGALFPAQTDYLYFVADGRTGAHRFSRTYSEHRANVELLRRARKSEAASPPPDGAPF